MLNNVKSSVIRNNDFTFKNHDHVWSAFTPSELGNPNLSVLNLKERLVV